MSGSQYDQLKNQARRGVISRRDVLRRGLQLGMTTPAILGLMALAPEVTAAPLPSGRALLPRPQDGAGGTFVYLRDGGIPDIDPHYAYNNAAQSVILGPYEMLIQYKGDTTDQYEPMLAESWEASPDNSTFTFKLPAGVKFHDGDICDARAVKASFDRLLGQNASVANVVNRFVTDPNMIEAVDEVTVRFNLGKPQPLFLAAMAASYGPFIVNVKNMEENKTDEDPWAHEWYRSNAIGTGPYVLKEAQPNEQFVLEKFADYHRGWDGPHYDQIVCRIVIETATRRQLVERGEAQGTTQNLSVEDVDSLKSDPNVQVLSYPSTAVYWSIMNVPRMKTVDVRKGFSLAFPYDEVVASAYRGLIKRSGPLASTVRAYDPDVFLYQTDLTKAKELILSGGFKEGDSFDYSVPSGDTTEQTIGQLFQANLQQIGFDLEIVSMDESQRSDIVYGDSPAEDRPMFIGGWGWWPDYNDPWNQLYPNFTKAATAGGGSNSGFWINDRFETLMEQARTFTDEEQLVVWMKEAQNILTEQDPPAIFYGELLWNTVLYKDVEGFVGNPLYLSGWPFWKMHQKTT